MTGAAPAVDQLAALARLRLSMARSGRQRAGLAVGAGVLLGIGASTVLLGMLLPPVYVVDALTVMTVTLAAYPALTVALSMSAGGGVEMVPADQLVAYPVRPSTTYLVSLLLLPTNIAWLLQTLVLVFVATYVGAGLGTLLPALGVVAAYAVAATMVGQLAGWLAWGAWSRRRVSVRPLVLAAAATAVLVAAGRRWWTFDAAGFPGRVVLTAVEGQPGQRWLLGTGLALLAVSATLLGGPAAAWALRAADPGGRSEHRRHHARQPAPADPAALLLRTDRRSVWRSAPLRRGLVLVGVMPAVAAAAADLSWSELAVLPALVASGAALLFGVNAFCLDGPGALWLASVPVRPRNLLTSKLRVTAEVCAAAVGVAVASGALFAGRLPHPREALVVGLSAAVAVLQAVSSSVDWSVRRPYRADLRGPRDTPAPPGAMTRYSVLLAARTTVMAVTLSVAARLDTPWWGLVGLALVPVVLAARRLRGTYRRWSSPQRRAVVLVTVASG